MPSKRTVTVSSAINTSFIRSLDSHTLVPHASATAVAAATEAKRACLVVASSITSVRATGGYRSIFLRTSGKEQMEKEIRVIRYRVS